MRNKTQIPTDAQLVDAIIQAHATGDIASGTILLVYDVDGDELTAHVPYDTFGGPDGLRTDLEISLGDWVNGTNEGLENQAKINDVLVTQELLDDANEIFRDNIGKAVTEGGLIHANRGED